MNKISIPILLVSLMVTGCGLLDRFRPSDPPIEEPRSVEPGTTQPLPPEGKDFSDGRQLVRANIFINGIGISIMESYPIQVSVNLEGDLPTPCNSFMADVSQPNESNEVHIDVYTLIDPAETCIAMTQPFSENVPIPLEGVADGEYTIWINGEKAGGFKYPGG